MNGKVIAAVIVLLLGVVGYGLTSCTTVSPGYVGVKVDRYGSSAGVEKQSYGVGTYFVGFGQSMHEYPVSTQSHTWGKPSKEEAEAGAANTEFSFQDKSGLIVSGDISIAYHVDAAKAPVLFQKYRMDMDGIIAGPLRNQVRSAVVNVASQMGVEEIYGAKKAELVNRAKAQVQRYFNPYGLVIEDLFWAGPIRIPSSILDQINNRTRNEQQALAAQANLATVEADAASAIAKAKGQAEAQRLQAESLKSSPELIEKMWIEKWNGSMPQTVYCNSTTPCVQTGGH